MICCRCSIDTLNRCQCCQMALCADCMGMCPRCGLKRAGDALATVGQTETPLAVLGPGPGYQRVIGERTFAGAQRLTRMYGREVGGQAVYHAPAEGAGGGGGDAPLGFWFGIFCGSLIGGGVAAVLTLLLRA